MKNLNVSLLLCSAAALAFATGCASHPIALNPVGPGVSPQLSRSRDGALQVFSATEKSIPQSTDDNWLFDLHTGYEIYGRDGKEYAFVANHMSNMDTWPDTVTLPAGEYIVEAKATHCGQVKVPVIVESGKTTVLHLDDDWVPPKNTPLNQVVSLPNGAAVGWCATNP